jgi:hypothetical protein
MKRVPFPVPGVASIALLAAACDRPSPPPSSQPPSPASANPSPPSTQPSPAAGTSASTPATNSPAAVLDLPRQTLTFKPSRDDMTVGKVVFSVYCSHPDEVRINGVRPDPAWSDVHLADAEIVVDRRLSAGRTHAWLYIDLPEAGKNQFLLAPLKIGFTGDKPSGMICASVKVWFKEVTNQYDSMFYEKTDDRYALVSFCTRPPEESDVESRFKQNRVATAAEFKDALSKPFVIKLNQRELRDEWSK